jgi:alkylated DNA repair dioxygenase AlkB
LAAAQFNSALLNLYRDGKDSVGWHRDNEPELGREPVIASVSFGASRSFRLRHIQQRLTRTIELDHGSLLLMRGRTQQFWEHAITKTSRPVGPRINITFRVLI